MEAVEWPDRCHLVRITAVLNPVKHEVNTKYLETNFLLSLIYTIMVFPVVLRHCVWTLNLIPPLFRHF
jgi:hypothetical protein